MTAGRGVLRSPIFVDASAWLASGNRHDQYHGIARSLLDACFRQQIQLVTTNWTSYEALSMLKGRVGPQSAEALWGILSSRWVRRVDVTKDVEQRALDLFFGYRDKTWGVVDCASLIVMEDLGCRHAFGFDHHFVEASRQRGFELLP